jgi:superfamily II DNA or RNA helicase
VATRTPHILILDGLLRRAGLDVECLNSVHSTKERDDVFAWVTAGPARVLVASTVKEGVSLPELKAGVIADVVCSSDLARQIIGRFIRKKPDGDNHARIAWFVDRLYPSARRGCQELFRELEKLKGYNFYWPCHLPGNPGKLYCAATCD